MVPTESELYVIWQANIERLNTLYPGTASWADVSLAVARERERLVNETFRALLADTGLTYLAALEKVALRETLKPPASASLTPPPAPYQATKTVSKRKK